VPALSGRFARPIVSVLAAAFLVAAAVAFGPVKISTDVLVGLGFDPDRADLITALIIGGTASLAAYLAGGIRVAAVVIGLVVCAAMFGTTFVRETQNAMAATGTVGAFSPLGWVQTLLAFVVVGLLTVWACATCAIQIRRELIVTGSAVRVAAGSGRRAWQAWARPAGVALIVCLLAVTVPVAGDLFDKGTDNRMIVGGPPRQGLVPQDVAVPIDAVALADPEASASPSAPASQGPSPSESPSEAPSPSATATPVATGWQGSVPTGTGRLVYLNLHGPWAGPATEQVAVYLPPGYDANSTKRYPTVYEAGQPFAQWNSAVRINSTLDQLIAAGTIPPALYLFMDSWSGPYPDSECADSYDQTELMDTYMSKTVPAYIDGHFRTIAEPAARAVMGMSYGGYCAAVLALRHPDVFGQSLSFSGYFTAGSGGASAKLPFGGNANLIANGSPTWLAPKLPTAKRAGLYFVLVAQTSQAFYGTEATKFSQILLDAGYRYDLVDSEDPHGWQQVRTELQQSLVLVAENQAARGVFG
jgi:enterochelin esterase-like enzyme